MFWVIWAVLPQAASSHWSRAPFWSDEFLGGPFAEQSHQLHEIWGVAEPGLERDHYEFSAVSADAFPVGFHEPLVLWPRSALRFQRPKLISFRLQRWKKWEETATRSTRKNVEQWMPDTWYIYIHDISYDISWYYTILPHTKWHCNTLIRVYIIMYIYNYIIINWCVLLDQCSPATLASLVLICQASTRCFQRWSHQGTSWWMWIPGPAWWQGDVHDSWCLHMPANIMQLWHRNKIIFPASSTFFGPLWPSWRPMIWIGCLAWSRTGAAPTWLWHFWFGALPRLQTSTVSWQILCHGIACELVD